MARLVSLMQELIETRIPTDLMQSSKISSIEHKGDSQNMISNLGKLLFIKMFKFRL
jgi:hypothetical protein